MALTLAGDGVVGGLSVPVPGLVLVDSVSFTSQSSVSIDGCFTDAYDDYLVLVKALGSVAGYVQVRLRAAGVDESGSVYNHQKLQGTSTTAAAQAGGSQNAINSTFQVGTLLSAFSFDVMNPDVAGTTSFRGSGGYSGFAGAMAGHVATSTAYDGITLFPTSGTITGTISVYGYSKVVGAADAYANPPQSGLELVTSQSFTAASSVSVDNCFTSTYDNYLMVVTMTAASGTPTTRVKLRAGGTDSSASYSLRGGYSNWGSSGNINDSSVTTGHGLTIVGSVSSSFAELFIAGPALASATNFRNLGYGDTTSGNSSEWTTGVHAVASSYDGFTLYTSSSTISGSLSVYGYTK